MRSEDYIPECSRMTRFRTAVTRLRSGIASELHLTKAECGYATAFQNMAHDRIVSETETYILECSWTTAFWKGVGCQVRSG